MECTFVFFGESSNVDQNTSGFRQLPRAKHSDTHRPNLAAAHLDDVLWRNWFVPAD
jgi:hypothetical protein